MKQFLLPLAFLSLTAHGQLVFDSLKKEIHAAPDADQVFCDFTFENKGSNEAVIKDAKTTCSCISVEIDNGGKLNYAPGEKGVLRATFKMENFSGQVDKNVLVSMVGDKETEPTFNLVVTVFIPVLVSMEPKTLEWNLRDSLEPKTLKIKMNHTAPIKITRVSMTNSSFQTELKTITEGAEYDLVVTPVSKDGVSPGLGVLHIETDCSIEKQKRQMAFAVVRNAPLPAPSVPSVSPLPPGKAESAKLPVPP